MKVDPSMDTTNRIAKLKALLVAANCPAIALVPGPNFYYLTGVDLALMERPTILVITANGDLHAAIPALERDRWTAQVPQAQTIYWQDSDGYADALAQLAKQVGVSLLFVEGNRMRQFEAAALGAAFGAPAADGTAILSSLRLIKEPSEVLAIRRAVDISEAALTATLSHVRAGMSETEIRARLQVEMLERGADGPGFDLIVLAGGAAADCHGIPSADRILKPGDALLFDFGAKLNGYSADITRTYFCQEVPKAHRQFYETVLEANRVGREMVAPGVAIHDLDQAVQSVLRDAGYGDNIRHKVGHGLGLDIHEAPQLMLGNHDKLQEGMLITIEPGLYDPGVIGVRIEDDVLVTHNGARSLTSLPREIQVIGQ